MSAATTIIALAAVVLALLYYSIKRKYSYWERKGVQFVEPVIPHGNFKDIGKIQQGRFIQNFYNDMKGKAKFFGLYAFHDPIVVPTDLDLIKSVLIKDFEHFRDRAFYTNERDDPLSAHLFTISGAKWRQLRMKLTPTFTSGKMKFMYPTIVNVAKEFKLTLDQLMVRDGNADVEIKELLARFTTDVIGQCAFGIECNSLKNPDAEFRDMGRRVFEIQKGRFAKFLITSISPKLARFLHVTTTRKDVSDFFMGIVKETVSFREKNNITRKDFMDLLIKLKNPIGQDDNGEKINGITMNELSAQAYVFFLAGFETSSTVMSFAIYEFTKNKEIQDRARTEIKQVLDRHNGVFSYEAMLDMTYVDQMLQESMRKYPPVPNLHRKVTKPYKVPGTDVVLDEDTQLWIPVYALHHDPEYFPNPDVYDPERFTPVAVQARNPATFLPFGDGPRNCIGLRFGMMQTRVGLVTLLLNYEMSFCEKSVVPLVISQQSFVVSSEGGVYINLKKIT